MSDMGMREYHALAQRTSNTATPVEKIDNGLLGLMGEAGELSEPWKKYLYQGHEHDREKMIDELGDVLWYCAEIASGLCVPLDEVARLNIEKLRERYPEGFDRKRSRERD